MKRSKNKAPEQIYVVVNSVGGIGALMYETLLDLIDSRDVANGEEVMIYKHESTKIFRIPPPEPSAMLVDKPPTKPTTRKKRAKV